MKNQRCLCELIGLFAALIGIEAKGDLFADWTVRSPVVTSNWLYRVLYANNQFVVVGNSGTVQTSKDSLNWDTETTDPTANLYGLAYSNNGFVAVGANVSNQGVVLTSPDGKIWTSQNISSRRLLAVAFGDDHFVAVGDNGTILASPDGISWANVGIGETRMYRDVIFSAGKFLIVGGIAEFANMHVSSPILTSPNGIQWTKNDNGYDVPNRSTYDFYSIAYGNGVFVAKGPHSTSISNDAAIWTPVYLDIDANLVGFSEVSRVAFFNGKFVAFEGSIFTSPDGQTWNRELDFLHPLLSGMAFGNNHYVGVGYYGTLVTSTNLVNWTQVDGVPRTRLLIVTYGNGSFVAVGGSASTKSRDGAEWRMMDSVNADLNGIAFGAGTFVAVGRSGAIYSTSDSAFDTLSWTQRTSGVTNNLSSVTFGNGQFIAVSSDDSRQLTTQAIIRSVDGKTWLRTSAPPRYLLSVTYGRDRFVAVGGTNVVNSLDGVTWNSVNPPMSSLGKIAYGNGRFIAVGDAGINAGRVASSPDGLTWTVQSGVPDVFEDLSFANGLFIGIAHSSTGILRNFLMLTSVDGLKWKFNALPGFFYGLSYANGCCVAVGDGGTIAQSGQFQIPPRFLLSNLKMNAQGKVEIGVESPIDSVIRLEVGTDFQSWTELSRTTNKTGTVQFEEPLTPGSSYRFYRASQMQP